MEEKQVTSQTPISPKKHILNIFVIIFVVGLSIASMVTFLIAFINGATGDAYSIASIYILAMLLGAPTLKVFLDNAKNMVMKKLNVAAIIFAFVIIFAVVILMVVDLAYFRVLIL